MIGKIYFGLLMAVMVVFSAVNLAFAEATIQERTGKITRIVGNQVTVKAKDGREVTGEVNSTQGFKVGDEVAIKEVDRPGRTKGFVIERPGQTKGIAPDVWK